MLGWCLADSADENLRISEIETSAHGLRVQTIPVVPIRETEAWLLLNEAAIRSRRVHKWTRLEDF